MTMMSIIRALVVASVLVASIGQVASAQSVTLVVFVVRDSDGAAIPDAQVCVGTQAWRDRLEKVKTTGTSGRAVFSTLTKMYPHTFQYIVTASKGGYIGGESWAYFPGGTTTNSVTIRLRPGTGGLICPGAQVQLNATPIVTATPDPPRLLEEMLAVRGDQGMHETNNTKFTCRKFGANYVLTGLKVMHNVTSLIGFDLYCAPLRADGTLGTNIFLPALAPTGGTPQQTVCPTGHAVAGYQGTFDSDRDIRSLRLHCATLGPGGLVSGSSTLLGSLGIQSGSAWGPDMCTQRRPASALRSHVEPPMFNPLDVEPTHSIQLLCEQPQRPSQ